MQGFSMSEVGLTTACLSFLRSPEQISQCLEQDLAGYIYMTMLQYESGNYLTGLVCQLASWDPVLSGQSALELVQIILKLL